LAINVLLTGGTGYIGSHTAVVLLEHGYKVFLFDDLSNSSIEVKDNIEKITSKKVQFIQGDVRNTELLQQILGDFNISAVIHFAGLKAVGESVEKPIEYFDNNITGSISLLKAMKLSRVNKFVFSSSATVYGEPKYLPYDENHPTSATNPYGRSKLYIEEILKDLCVSNKEFSAICLRYFNPVGAHESGLIGEFPRGMPNNLMPYIAQVASSKLDKLRIFGGDYNTPDGTGVRDYIHVVDLAEGHVSAIDFIENNIGWNAINLGRGKGISVLEILNAFEKTNSVKVPYAISERRNGDIDESYASVQMAEKLLNWRAKKGIDEMCKSVWNFQKGLD